MKKSLLCVMMACSGDEPVVEPQPPETSVAAIDATITTQEGIRDLVLQVDAQDASVVWYEDDVLTELRDHRVPAHRLWPGHTWRAELTQGRRTGSASYTVPEPAGDNVLLILLDDVGIDKVSAYGRPESPDTPVMDSLADQGVRFNRAYASMVCTPTRAALLTGRQPRRSGLGWIIDTDGRDQKLPLASITIPEALEDARTSRPWSHSAAGKWHLAGRQGDGWETHPMDQGFDWYAGAPGNPMYRPGTGYDLWQKNTMGEITTSDVYMTTDTTSDAIERMQTMPEPWFMYVSYNAVHTPLGPPPADLIEEVPDADAPDWVMYDAMLEALDTELGRMFDSMGEPLRARTTIILVGDNGTHHRGVVPENATDRNKETPYEGGIRVPMLISGPHVAQPGTTSDALVHVVDVLPTIADIAGVPLGGTRGEVLGDEEPRVLDGVSLLPFLENPDTPGREFLYTEAFMPNGPTHAYSIDRRVVRDDQWKLIRWANEEEFFRMDDPDGLDRDNLLLAPLDPEAAEAYGRLSNEMLRLDVTLAYEGR